MKDLPGVHVRLTGDGTTIWTMPSGRTIHIPAYDHTPEPGPHDQTNDSDPWEPPPHTRHDTMPDHVCNT